MLTGFRVAPTGACKSKHEFGVKIGSNIGAELKLEASHVKDENDPIVNVTIAVRSSCALIIHLLEGSSNMATNK